MRSSPAPSVHRYAAMGLDRCATVRASWPRSCQRSSPSTADVLLRGDKQDERRLLPLTSQILCVLGPFVAALRRQSGWSLVARRQARVASPCLGRRIFLIGTSTAPGRAAARIRGDGDRLAAHIEVKGNHRLLGENLRQVDYRKNSLLVSAPVPMRLDVPQSGQQGSRMAQSDYLILGLVPMSSAT